MSAPGVAYEFTVRVPATSANLGPGFDTLGIALSYYDELRVQVLAEPATLEISVEGEGSGSVPLDDSHLVVASARHVLSAVGRELPGLRLHAINRIPHGRGMGSSGSAIVAGVMLAATVLARGEQPLQLSSQQLLTFATELEGHPDNVAPALFGGLTVSWMEGSVPRCKKLTVAPGVLPLVAAPEFTLSTEVARSLQPQTVPLTDAVFNVSRAALLIAALTQSPELLLPATEDRLHQGYRGEAMLPTRDLIARLRGEGLPAVVSGAGPSVLVLAAGESERQRAASLISGPGDEAAGGAQATWRVLPLEIPAFGATVDDVPAQEP